nr:hypothetical protein JVH1_3947 [Rhodococcus sp. JVH1]
MRAYGLYSSSRPEPHTERVFECGSWKRGTMATVAKKNS